MFGHLFWSILHPGNMRAKSRYEGSMVGCTVAALIPSGWAFHLIRMNCITCIRERSPCSPGAFVWPTVDATVPWLMGEWEGNLPWLLFSLPNNVVPGVFSLQIQMRSYICMYVYIYNIKYTFIWVSSKSKQEWWSHGLGMDQYFQHPSSFGGSTF